MKNIKLLLIGGSAGCLNIILKLLPALKNNSNIAIVFILHRKSGGGSMLINLLATKTTIPVKEAEEKELIEGGKMYVAPADYHLLIESNHTFSLDFSEKVNFSRPCIDVSFETGARAFQENAIGLLLSGANSDGTNGLVCIKKNHGIVLVQNPATAEVPFMPQYAKDHVEPNELLDLDEMIEYINHRIN